VLPQSFFISTTTINIYKSQGKLAYAMEAQSWESITQGKVEVNKRIYFLISVFIADALKVLFKLSYLFIFDISFIFRCSKVSTLTSFYWLSYLF